MGQPASVAETALQTYYGIANFILNRPIYRPATRGLIMLWSWATAHCSDYIPQSSSGGYTGPVLLVPTPTPGIF